jgi:hypothetical protein
MTSQKIRIALEKLESSVNRSSKPEEIGDKEDNFLTEKKSICDIIIYCFKRSHGAKGFCHFLDVIHAALIGGWLIKDELEISKISTGFYKLRIWSRLTKKDRSAILVTLSNFPDHSGSQIAVLFIAIFGINLTSPWSFYRKVVKELLVPLLNLYVLKSKYNSAFWCANLAYSCMRPVPDSAAQLLPTIYQLESALSPLYKELATRNARIKPDFKSHNKRVGFVIYNDTMLGHTENLLSIVEGLAQPHLNDKSLFPTVYIINNLYKDERLIKALDKIGVNFVRVSNNTISSKVSSPLELLKILKQRFRDDEMDIAIWVSGSILMPFAFSLGLAPTQIWWSMKFKHDAYPMADGYLYSRSFFPKRETVGNTLWNLGPKALPPALDSPSFGLVSELRQRFSNWELTLGVVAREQKICDPEYLEAVASILERHPHCGFAWTGSRQNPDISDFFRRRGLESQNLFIGWVDPAVAVRSFDVYLDTFTLSGLTTIYALAAGTAVVELRQAEGPLSALLDSVVEAENTADPVALEVQTMLKDLGFAETRFSANTAADYIEKAEKLIVDKQFRRSFGSVCQKFARGWLADPRRSAFAFTENVFDIISRQCFLNK